MAALAEDDDGEIERLRQENAILSCMVEDAGVWMMLSDRWFEGWTNDPEAMKILSSMNIGIPSSHKK